MKSAALHSAMLGCIFATALFSQVTNTLVQPQSIVAPPNAAPVSIARPVIEPRKFSEKLWMSSVLALGAASALDAGTSWGKLEGNKVLASSNGEFGARGAAIKGVMFGAMVIPQIIFRHHPALLRIYTIVNFAETGVYGIVAIHNAGIAPPPQ